MTGLIIYGRFNWPYRVVRFQRFPKIGGGSPTGSISDHNVCGGPERSLKRSQQPYSGERVPGWKTF